MRLPFWCLLSVLAVSPVGAQGRPGGPPQRRAQEFLLRQRIERVVTQQLGLTDQQMVQLRQIDGRFEVQRNRLAAEERQIRQTLRRLLQDTSAVDQGRIAEELDRLLKIPARRGALVEAEQRELAAVLTPKQRAQYHAIQEQVREQIRRQIERGRPGSDPDPASPSAPHGGRGRGA